MTPIDTKLYELFSLSFDLILWGESYVKNNRPELHDVFRVSKEKGIMIGVSQGEGLVRVIGLITNDGGEYNELSTYNPTLSLMNQSEETKQAIINLFSHD